eukprot:scaffold1860_cov403-Prasinococcus_capsulatus_cf.AAC.11
MTRARSLSALQVWLTPAAEEAVRVTTCQYELVSYVGTWKGNPRMGAEAAMAPCTALGYFIRNHAASIPPARSSARVDTRDTSNPPIPAPHLRGL